tara:strand:- start:57 stop:614 length:558 start_codon:yes stop_codon:yes gene_type:complete
MISFCTSLKSQETTQTTQTTQTIRINPKRESQLIIIGIDTFAVIKMKHITNSVNRMIEGKATKVENKQLRFSLGVKQLIINNQKQSIDQFILADSLTQEYIKNEKTAFNLINKAYLKATNNKIRFTLGLAVNINYNNERAIDNGHIQIKPGILFKTKDKMILTNIGVGLNLQKDWIFGASTHIIF